MTIETAPASRTPAGWSEVRFRAVQFVRKWNGETRERAEKDTFWNDLLAVYGVDRRQVARFEPVARRYSTGRAGFIDLLWPGRLLVEHKSAGQDLEAAMQQAIDYLPGMSEEDVPRLIVVCDFEHFRVHDLDTSDQTSFTLSELPDRLDVLGLLAGRGRRKYETEEDVNLAATTLLARFHDALKVANYDEHARRVLLTRILFCLFADDAGVWPSGLFEDYLHLRTRPDGSDLGSQLAWLFQLLDTAENRRSRNLPNEAVDFTYVNGGLFAETLPISDCTAEMRTAVLAACRFNWSRISPAIFGSMFQNVMEPLDRRRLGAHYTTEANILRTIKPLFLDGLENELIAAGTDRRRLQRFRDNLSELTFFDPACGCGNFLVVAYREIRRLELRCLLALRDAEIRSDRRGRGRLGAGQLAVDVTIESKVRVGQFYGIELEEFPCRIAETAMHLADHLANEELSAELGIAYARFPIADTSHIFNGNAATAEWGEVLTAEKCTILFGNPPFHGMAWMTPEQQADRTKAFGELEVSGTRTGRLDYVAAWYAKAMRYMANTPIRAAFVSTNSLFQGDQARSLGPLFLAAEFHIDFAHRTFEWRSEASGAAHVHVVIVGFSHRVAGRSNPLRLFEYPQLRGEPVELRATNINPYLVDAPDVVPPKRTRPMRDDLPLASKGSQPTDGGFLIVEPEDYPDVSADPHAAKYLRTFWQTQWLLRSKPKWCLWLAEADPADLRRSPVLRRRLDGVREARKKSPTASVRAFADRPARFTQIRQPATEYLAIPEVSSGSRRYIPVCYMSADDIAGNKLICFPGGDLRLFGLLQSRAFTAWVDAVGGKWKSDYSLSPELTYCTFPFPLDTPKSREKIEKVAKAVLDERERHPGSTLADLYSVGMPDGLFRAHQALDVEVDRQITGRKRNSDADRLAALFTAYKEVARVPG